MEANATSLAADAKMHQQQEMRDHEDCLNDTPTSGIMPSLHKIKLKLTANMIASSLQSSDGKTPLLWPAMQTKSPHPTP